MSDPIRTMFNKITRTNASNSFYCLPKKYIDCRQLVQQRKKIQSPNHNPQYISQRTKEKLFKKTFYLDESLRSAKEMPGPNQLDIAPSFRKLYKSQSTYITKPLQRSSKNKRDTWIEDIERYQQKFKQPGVCKYDLLKNSDFNIRKQKSLSLLKTSTLQKVNNLDDIQYVSAQIPGPGSHNPRKIVKKLKINPVTLRDMLNKKQSTQKKQKKTLNSSKLSSCSYNPIIQGTFDSLRKQPKQAGHNMKTISVQIRQGRRSLQTIPNLFKHASLNQWTTAQNFYKEKEVGKIKLFNLTSNSFGKNSVYH